MASFTFTTSSNIPVRDVWEYHTRNNGSWGDLFWGNTQVAAWRKRHNYFVWALEPCGSIPADRNRFHCGPECTTTCHITTICTGNCHKNWYRPSALATHEMPNWRSTNVLKDARSWKAWELEFCTRLKKMSPGMIAVLRGDMTFADFHTSNIANLTHEEASRRAKQFEELSRWVSLSVLFGYPIVYEDLEFQGPDLAVGPVWDAWLTFHANAALRIYWHLYHLCNVDRPQPKGLRGVWDAARAMVASRPADKPACRCLQCLADDEPRGTLPSLSHEQYQQSKWRLGELLDGVFF